MRERRVVENGNRCFWEVHCRSSVVLCAGHTLATGIDTQPAMFGYMLFKNGEQPYKTPHEFQQRAREDIENHIRKFNTNATDSTSTNDVLNPVSVVAKQKVQQSPLLQQHSANHHISGLAGIGESKEQTSPDTINKSSLKYGSSPLRNTMTASTTVDSSDECSSIDSGKSGCSLSHESAQLLLRQQQDSLNRIFSRTSTIQNSVFTTEMNSLYTANTLETNPTLNQSPVNNLLALNDALPKDFSDYYSPDLEVERFSNGRPVFTRRALKNWELNDLRSLLIFSELKPEWNNKIPEISSPYPNIHFRIQIIPNYFADEQIIQYLTHSDIYKEAKLDLEFRNRTATFIVMRARVRHKQILIDSFGVNPSNFILNQNLVGDIKTDSYFKFEWRNIIENYLLNLGIENECRIEFKSRISKLKKITQEKRSTKGKSNKSLKNNLYKKVLLENKAIDESLKINIWKEVKSDVYRMLNMDGWDVN